MNENYFLIKYIFNLINRIKEAEDEFNEGYLYDEDYADIMDILQYFLNYFKENNNV